MNRLIRHYFLLASVLTFALVTKVDCVAEEQIDTAHSPPTELVPDSLYQLSSSWTSNTGKPLTLASLSGSPVVLTMIYTSCQYSCPATLAVLKKIEATLTELERKRVKFVLVTFDTEKDNPSTLASFAKQKGLNLDRWVLLHGTADDTRELAVVLNIKYKEVQGGDFAHSNVITLLDSGGRVVVHHPGLDLNVAGFVEAIRKLPSDKK